MADSIRRILVRRDTLDNWTGVVPQNGEPIGIITDDPRVTTYKIGDGVTPAEQLPALSKGDRGDKGAKGDTGLPGTNGVATDDATASNISTPGTKTRTAITDFGASQFTAAPTNLTAFAKRLRTRAPLTIALAGDSTGDEWAEWFSRTADAYQAAHPTYSETYNGWSDANQAWTSTARQAGTAPVVDTTPLFDDFSQRSGEVVGSAPTRQPALAWTNNSGLFSIDPTTHRLISSGGNGSSNSVLPSSMPQAQKLTLSGVMLVDSTAPSSSAYLNVGFFTSGGARRLSLQVRVGGGTGAVSTSVEGQMPSYVALGAGPALTLASPNAINEVPFTMVLAGTQLTVTIGGGSKTFTLTSDQAAAIAPANGIQLLPGNCAGWGMKSVRLDMQYTVGTAPALIVYNGSKAGTTLAYQQPIVGTMFPASTRIDALLISSSHNYGTMNASDYIAAVASYLADFTALHPDTAIILVAQNPEAPPQPDAVRAAHIDRVTALKGYAQRRGYGFIDAYSAFHAYGTNWAQKILRPDGLHPNAAGNAYDGQLSDPDNGAYVWTQAAFKYLESLGA